MPMYLISILINLHVVKPLICFVLLKASEKENRYFQVIQEAKKRQYRGKGKTMDLWSENLGSTELQSDPGFLCDFEPVIKTS